MHRRVPPEATHFERMRRILDSKPTIMRKDRPRSNFHQRRRRELEFQVRRGAVEYRRFRIIEGGTARDVARELGRSRRTLSEWARRTRKDGLQWVARGRPKKRSSAWERNQVISDL